MLDEPETIATSLPSLARFFPVRSAFGRRTMNAYLTSTSMLLVALAICSEEVGADDCSLLPVIHILQYPGCDPKPMPSFACQGKCTSYVQVSGSKVWQIERSCNCCQESGVREAIVSLRCKARNKGSIKRKITTRAPTECMCRPCIAVDTNAIIPQEVAPYEDQSFF